MKIRLVALITILALATALFFLDRGGHVFKNDQNIFALIANLTGLDSKQKNQEVEIYNRNFIVRIKPSVEDLHAVMVEWLPYYHRHKDDENLLSAIKVMAASEPIEQRYLYLFKHLFSEQPDLEATVQGALTKLSKKKQTVIRRILDQPIREPLQPNVDFPTYDSVYGEFAASGDTDIIDRLLKVFEPTGDDQDIDLLDRYTHIFVKLARDFYPIYSHVGQENRLASGQYKERLNTLESKIYDAIYKPAYHFYYRGKSYAETSNYVEALNTYFKGLELAPDDPYLYVEIGRALVKLRKSEDALSSFKRAQQSASASFQPTVLYEIAMAQYSLGEIEKTEEIFLQQYGDNPDDPIAINNVAWFYEDIGNFDKAAEYYHKVLAIDKPNSMRVYALEFLEKNKRSIPDMDMQPGDLLFLGQFEELESRLSDILKSRELDRDGRLKSTLAQSKLTPSSQDSLEAFHEYLQSLKKWHQQYPESSFSNTALGAFYLDFAWKARGIGYSSTITSEARKLFHERLELAAKYLEKAYDLNPSNSFIASEMMIVAKVSPAYSEGEVETWYKRAIQAEPIDHFPYKARLNFLRPKWGGSYEEAFAFARDVYETAPQNCQAPVLLTNLHWTMLLNENQEGYFLRLEVWQELKDVYIELLRRFPDSEKWRGFYAKAACLAEDFETAHQLFQKIDGQWSTEVWNSKEEFEHYLDLTRKKVSLNQRI